MVRLQLVNPTTKTHAQAMLQTAIGVELGTLPPYLYALYSIRPGTNSGSAARIRSIVLQEMVHMSLACNILNALGGNPVLIPPVYPGPLPGDIGPNGTPLTVHLLPFSSLALQQAMEIEQPASPLVFPIGAQIAALALPTSVTIGEFYAALDAFLATLAPSDWSVNRNQIDDSQFFAGQVFAVNGYADAKRAIGDIVSEGEGARDQPLDFQGEPAHYYRFGEIFNDRILTKANNPLGYQWGPDRLDVDWSAAAPAISDPTLHDFSKEPSEAQAAQTACNSAYSILVDHLQAAVSGQSASLSLAVRAMFNLRTAALSAFTAPLADKSLVAGPSFQYVSTQSRPSS